MGYTDIQQVCLNGHQITDAVKRTPDETRKHCPDCGAKTITNCPECDSTIPGYTFYDPIIGGGDIASVPSHCHNCGSPFPWTKRNETIVSEIQNTDAMDAIVLISKICSRFHLVTKQLRNRYDDRKTLDITDEYDVQDLLHALLRVFFDDIRPEEWTPSYAGKSSRMDFLIKGQDVVIEVKMTRKGLGAKEVGTQLIDDIARYKKHPECKTLICFVYDPEGRISNPAGLESDLSDSHTDLKVIVLIVPKGY